MALPRPSSERTLLEVDGLQTHFATPAGVVRAVDGLSFTVEAGETVAIVFAALAFNVLGDGLRDIFDPRTTR